MTLRPRTVFFGGGTPSLLPPGEMRRLLDGLRERFDLTGVEEWTVEVNPATADVEYLRMLVAGGVDRVSFGAQSFDSRDLKCWSDITRPATLRGRSGWRGRRACRE